MGHFFSIFRCSKVCNKTGQRRCQSRRPYQPRVPRGRQPEARLHLEQNPLRFERRRRKSRGRKRSKPDLHVERGVSRPLRVHSLRPGQRGHLGKGQCIFKRSAKDPFWRKRSDGTPWFNRKSDLWGIVRAARGEGWMVLPRPTRFLRRLRRRVALLGHRESNPGRRGQHSDHC